MSKNKKKVKFRSPQPLQEKKMREILIQTDGTNIHIAKNETTGALELQAILEALLRSMLSKK